MSDDEADPELLALLAQSLGLGPKPEAPPSTGVLKSVEYVYDNALDVSISSQGTKAAAELLYHQLQRRQYSTYEWSKHELHPKPVGGEATVNFIFTMNLLNFSFWSELPEADRFCVEWNGKRWTGYWSLVAALQRALAEGRPITTPSYWSTCTDDDFAHIFRSATSEPIPLLQERIRVLRTASTVWSDPSTCPVQTIHDARGSAARLVNILVEDLPSCFADTATYNGKFIHLYKRVQILVADLWACFNGASYGAFDDIDTALTMFADYRVPQMLQRLGALWYSPRLEGKVRRGELLESGETLEVEVRACSVWAVELLRREMARKGWDEWEAEVEVEQDDSDQDIPLTQLERDVAAPVQTATGPETYTNRTEETSSTLKATSSDDQSPQAAIKAPSSAEPNNTVAVEPPPPEEVSAADRPDAGSPHDPSASTPSTSTPLRSHDQPEPRPIAPTSLQPESASTTHAQPQSQPPLLQPTTPTPSFTTTTTNPNARKSPSKFKVKVKLNAILLDYLLYDVAKEQEQALLLEAQAAEHPKAGETGTGNAGAGADGSINWGPDGSKVLPHHRTRSIWY